MKVLNMFKWAATIGMDDDTSMVVVHDDEYCFQPEILRGLCHDAMSNNQSLYAGKRQCEIESSWFQLPSLLEHDHLKVITFGMKRLTINKKGPTEVLRLILWVISMH